MGLELRATDRVGMSEGINRQHIGFGIFVKFVDKKNIEYTGE